MGRSREGAGHGSGRGRGKNTAMAGQKGGEGQDRAMLDRSRATVVA